MFLSLKKCHFHFFKFLFKYTFALFLLLLFGTLDQFFWMFIASFYCQFYLGACHLYIPLLASFGLMAQLLLFIILRTQTQIRGSSKQKQPFFGCTKRGNGERSNGGRKWGSLQMGEAPLRSVKNQNTKPPQTQEPNNSPSISSFSAWGGQ